VISDASFGDAVTQQFVNEMAAANLDFVLHLGDVVHETEWGLDPYASYAEKFYTPFAPLLQQLPVYTVAGNHDYDATIRYNEEPFYFNAFPPAPSMANRQFYPLDYGGVRFLLLDAMTMWGMPGRAEQDAWLSQQLQDTETPTIAVFHIAPFSSSSVHPEDSAPLRNLWVPQFESANVPLVLSGHFHHYERLLVNDIHYIVAGGGSEVTYALGPFLPESQFVQRVSSYVLLELGMDTIYLQAIDINGNMIDELTINK
jgi:predicted phosphodiesterase